MRIMGHKARAKEVVAAAGVPVLPGAVVTPGAEGAGLAAVAEPVGFPLLVKASAGGGGRGMRVVERPDELGEAVSAARREASAAFGSDEVFVERFLAAPRHVEVQVVGDAHGNVVHLFDRECSVQRRHQKVIEEAPASAVPTSVRRRMWDAAVAAAGAVGYESAGTVEFLVEGSEFWFLEMNTRLQVEHGVTELVTGLDVVGLQLSVASGRPLPFAQPDVAVNGHAVEVRMCAERPREDYRPTPGTVTHVSWAEGPGLRTDGGIESGSTVGAAYDSLVAKLMAYGIDRDMAVERLARSIRSLELDGLETNRDLLTAVLDDEAYRLGQVDVHYLERRPDLRDARLPDAVRHRHAAAAALALLAERGGLSLVPVPAAGWRNVGAALHADELRDGAGTVLVRAPSPGAPVSVQVGERWLEVGTGRAKAGLEAAGATVSVDLVSADDGLRRRHGVRMGAHGVWVNGPEGQSTFALRLPDDEDERGGLAGECRAPLPGAVTKVLVAVGDVVAEGDPLVVLEAMKMEHTLRADGAGSVSVLAVAPGQQVDVGDLLVSLEPS
jgi:acetyl/propionyl-CoA carboxylase alpha subunit